jgi:sugar phosphate isomerase/epimerase
MQLGLVTYNLAKDWDLSTLIANCEKTGFHAVELRTTHAHGVEPTLDADARRGVREAFAGSSVRLHGLGSVCEFHSPDPAVVRRHVADCAAFAELARDVGARGVKVRPNGLPAGVPVEKTLEQIGGALRECAETAAGFGVEIWLEVHGPGTSDLRHVRTIMYHADHPNAKVCWNSNMTDLGPDGGIGEGFALVADRIGSVHINEICRPDYPWRDLFRLLRGSGYDGPCLAEAAESADPLRVMHYYRALFDELSRA